MEHLSRLGVGELAGTLLLIAVVAALGLALGQLRIRGVGLGVAGVLFAGLVAGHFGFSPPPASLELLRDLGLLLFVYAIGAAVGPGFFQSLRRGGLRLNLLATAVVLGGLGLAALAVALLGLDVAGVAGVLAGATTNTPSLGAAQQVLDGMPGLDAARRGLPSLGYAVAYPFGVLGIIGSLAALRAVFRVDPRAEAQALLDKQRAEHTPLQRRSILIDNKNLDGLALKEVPGLAALGVVVSRVLPAAARSPERARPETILHDGDALLVVGERDAIDKARIILGRVIDLDFLGAPGEVAFRRLVVTRADAVDKTLVELEVALGGSVTFTRVRRGEVELTARPEARLRFGDLLQVVGAPTDLDRAAALVGNQDKALSATELLPVFLGLALGVILGNIALPVAGLPAPLKLGLAGGPLLTAIVLGRVGRVGPIIWYMPGNVNVALRELGMSLFLAAVGMKAGAHVVEALRSGAGPTWLGIGIAITVVPMLIVGAVGRIAMRLDYPTLAGVLAGSMTDPPALAFAQGMTGSDAPAVGYAAVYPVTMVLRIVAAQILVLWFS